MLSPWSLWQAKEQGGCARKFSSLMGFTTYGNKPGNASDHPPRLLPRLSDQDSNQDPHRCHTNTSGEDGRYDEHTDDEDDFARTITKPAGQVT